jgi:hypothetical protein
MIIMMVMIMLTLVSAETATVRPNAPGSNNDVKIERNIA